MRPVLRMCSVFAHGTRPAARADHAARQRKPAGAACITPQPDHASTVATLMRGANQSTATKKGRRSGVRIAVLFQSNLPSVPYGIRNASDLSPIATVVVKLVGNVMGVPG